MPRIILPFETNPLAYPGRLPGFDPGHFALGGKPLYSGVRSGANFINLLTSASGTVTGTFTSALDGNLGPSLGCGAIANSNQIAVSGAPQIAYQQGTIAAIVRPSDVTNFNAIFAGSPNTSGGLDLFFANDSGALGDLMMRVFGTNIRSNINNTVAGVPYFVVASCDAATNINFLQVNLNTGRVDTATAASSATLPLLDGTFLVAQWRGGGLGCTGNLAAVMYSGTYLSMAQLKQWAQDPWAFWYPRNTDFALMLKPASAAVSLPFNQYDWSKPTRVPRTPFDVSVALNPNLFKNPYPIFNQFEPLKPFNVPLTQPQPAIGININLFKNPYPIFNGDGSTSKVNPDWLPVPPPPLNINLFTNPFPVNQYDWSKPFRMPLALPQPAVGINPNIFTNPVPFLNPGPPAVWPVHDQPLLDVPYNQNLYSVTVVANPFYAAEVFLVQPIRGRPLFEQPYNRNLFTNPVPVFNSDQSSSKLVPDWLPSPVPPLNINLFTNPVPFNQYDFLKPFAIPLARLEPNQALNINVFTNLFPFNQYDWSKPIKVPQAPYSPTDPLNINLFLNPIPFLNIDTSRTAFLRSALIVDQPYNQNLYSIITVQVPFNQTDWSRAVTVRGYPSPDAAFNPNLFTNPYPFNQFDYPRSRRVPQAPFDLSVSVNLQLFLNPVPIYNINYVPVRQPLPVPLDTSQGFQILYQPFVPPPVVAAQYRLLSPHYLATGYTLAGTIVTEGKEIPFGWIPTNAVEPLNQPAIQQYWNVGPNFNAELSQDYYPTAFTYNIFVAAPKVFWKPVPGQPGAFILTGAGASLGAKTRA